MKEPTIIWKGTHGAAIVKWRASTSDTAKIKEAHGTPLLYLLGFAPPRYPVPAVARYIEPICFFCGSMNGLCQRAPQTCLDNQLRGY